MSGTDIAVIIGALIPLGGGIRWAWSEYRKTRASEIDKAIEAAVQTERANQYKAASEATIMAKNAELEEGHTERVELRDALRQERESHSRLSQAFDRLSKAYEALSRKGTA